MIIDLEILSKALSRGNLDLGDARALMARVYQNTWCYMKFLYGRQLIVIDFLKGIIFQSLHTADDTWAVFVFINLVRDIARSSGSQ